MNTIIKDGLTKPPPEAGENFSSPRRDDGGGAAAVAEEAVASVVEEMQARVNGLNLKVEYTTYGEKGERVAIVVSDRETGRVIREIPPKEIQQLYLRFQELQGILFDRRA
ncbi:MAG TPA: flagellar protein FlaG [Syntrophales bacterium]|nr:flagellar protein FlaG [Syntrophales bacterium]